MARWMLAQDAAPPRGLVTNSLLRLVRQCRQVGVLSTNVAMDTSRGQIRSTEESTRKGTLAIIHPWRNRLDLGQRHLVTITESGSTLNNGADGLPQGTARVRQ